MTIYIFYYTISSLNKFYNHLFQRDPKDELIERLEEENTNLQSQNNSHKAQTSSMQQDSLVKEQLLMTANQDICHKMAQLASLSKIIEGTILKK